MPWMLAFLVPFVVTFAALFEHERVGSLCDIERDRITMEQPLGQPKDEEAARKSAALMSSIISLPVGLVGLGVYGMFLTGRKLSKRRKD
jgi:hypothetical protein